MAYEPEDFYGSQQRDAYNAANPVFQSKVHATPVADARALQEIGGQMYGVNPTTGQFEPVVIDLETSSLYYQTGAPGGNVIPFTRHADKQTFLDKAIPIAAQAAPIIGFGYGAATALGAGGAGGAAAGDAAGGMPITE